MAKADIFISYSRKDHELVAKLVYLLEWYGYSVWWDIESLRSGEDFSEVIRKTINDVKCVIVIWSENSVQSQWVKAEARPALEAGKLAPFVIDQKVAIPLPFNNTHSESLEGWSGDPQERHFYRVLEAVGRFCPQPSKQAFVPRTSKELHSASSASPSPVSTGILAKAGWLLFGLLLGGSLGYGYFSWQQVVQKIENVTSVEWFNNSFEIGMSGWSKSSKGSADYAANISSDVFRSGSKSFYIKSIAAEAQYFTIYKSFAREEYISLIGKKFMRLFM